MSERGMKKYLPFSSLIEQETYLKKMLYEKNKVSKPQISIEQARKIDRILHEFDSDFVYSIKIYLDGYIYNIKTKILKMNLNKKIIYFTDFYIPIKNIIDIEDCDPFTEIC